MSNSGVAASERISKAYTRNDCEIDGICSGRGCLNRRMGDAQITMEDVRDLYEVTLAECLGFVVACIAFCLHVKRGRF